MYIVYILRSEKDGGYYTGYTSNIVKRLQQHNNGIVKATKYRRPYKVVYTEAHSEATEARKREYFIKSQKSRKFVEELIGRTGH